MSELHRAGRIWGISVAAATALLIIAAPQAPAAGGGVCGMPTVTKPGAHIEIQGTICAANDEAFTVYCDAMTDNLAVNYTSPPDPAEGAISAMSCGAATTGIWVKGNGGNDRIDLSSVTAAAGFNAINQVNILDGSVGEDTLIGSAFIDNALGNTENDRLLLRDGVADVGNCGAGSDSYEADVGLDTLIDCEIDSTPAPPLLTAAATPVTTPTPTAAAKKCKRTKKKRCKKKRKK